MELRVEVDGEVHALARDLHSGITRSLLIGRKKRHEHDVTACPSTPASPLSLTSLCSAKLYCERLLCYYLDLKPQEEVERLVLEAKKLRSEDRRRKRQAEERVYLQGEARRLQRLLRQETLAGRIGRPRSLPLSINL